MFEHHNFRMKWLIKTMIQQAAERFFNLFFTELAVRLSKLE
jgi:hypothetical protein